jgi:hypothetical protein
MGRKVKIRGWLIIIIGASLTYLVQPILTQSSFALSNPISRANLAYAGAVLGIGGEILICLGIIISIFKWFQAKFSKKQEIKK